jgi:hypothetical protein
VALARTVHETLYTRNKPMSILTVVVDPSLSIPPRPVGTTPRVYFRVDDGGATYTVVSRDRAHAEQILRESGAEFGTEDGSSVPYDQAKLEWKEISAERAAEIKVYEDDGSSGTFPLNTFEPGDWFCSEF